MSKIPTATWLKVKECYQSGEGSCAELATRFGLNPNSVSTRCRREQWRLKGKQLQRTLEKRLNERVERSLNETAQSLVQRAERFVRRSVDEAEDWLDQIVQAKAKLAEGDVEALCKLVNSWSVPIKVGRTALGLDQQQIRPNSTVNIDVLTVSPDRSTRRASAIDATLGSLAAPDAGPAPSGASPDTNAPPDPPPLPRFASDLA